MATHTPGRRKLTAKELADIRFYAKRYVDDQLATMAKHGGAPDLTPERYEKLIVDCMKPAIKAQRTIRRPRSELNLTTPPQTRPR